VGRVIYRRFLLFLISNCSSDVKNSVRNVGASCSHFLELPQEANITRIYEDATYKEGYTRTVRYICVWRIHSDPDSHPTSNYISASYIF
jgi:hypothetical protein